MFSNTAFAGGLDEFLIAYRPLDEGSGNKVVDATGNGNDGTIHGAMQNGLKENLGPLGQNLGLLGCGLNPQLPSAGKGAHGGNILRTGTR